MTIHNLAAELVAELSPACERIEIAGSIRRGKSNPKDIEIVCIPRISGFQEYDMFGMQVESPEHSELVKAVNVITSKGDWEFDPEVKRNGIKYKRLRHIDTRICCDLFITSPECWGVIFSIRTGPGDYSRELVTRARRMGMVVEGGNLYRTHRDNRRELIPTPEEEDFFKALGLEWIEPGNRLGLPDPATITLDDFRTALRAGAMKG